MQIKLLLTGGTIDKVYDEISQKMEFDKSHIEEMLRVSRQTNRIDVRQLLMKDSQHMSEADRKIIIQACQAAAESRIVITHGTDTMDQTARTLAREKMDKTIVLTGAMIPYSLGTKSDAMFNLGHAIACVQTLPPGVYIAMNGKHFPAKRVKKNSRNGVFTTTS